MADAKCGAKTRSGEPCKSRSMPNGRCRMHGGKSTGAGNPARPGNQHATKHGIYGDLVHIDEHGHIDGLMSAAGQVESELLVARLQLRRALRAQATADQITDGLELVERTDVDGGEAVAKNEEKFKLRDYNTMIDRLLARIESLEKTRAALLAAQGPGDDTDSMTRDDTFIAPDEPIPDAPIL
jgi:hypothetical protein